MIDKDRRFLLQLSLKLGVPVFELETWPAQVIQEYRALNVVAPFTQDAENWRDGIQIQMVRNQNITSKQHYKTAEELLPYLQEYPEFLEHKQVSKVLGLIKVCPDPEQVANLMDKVREEIEIESQKDDPDHYLISRLIEIYKANTRAAN
ncbi:MAG: hypothetical protein ACRC2Y_04825 [Aeromonas veronii]